VDAVVPVHNEQGALAASIRRLQDSLSTEVPFAWRILIADNASTDETPRVTAALTEDLSHGRSSAEARAAGGRGRRTACERRDADVLCYMDVDLSSDLRAVLPLLAPVALGHSDVTTGTRLAWGPRESRAVQSAS
jgi:glycosyltransferase involved in cell wall biosynthesis